MKTLKPRPYKAKPRNAIGTPTAFIARIDALLEENREANREMKPTRPDAA